MSKPKKLSRAARYTKALEGLDDILAQVEELKEEMENWRDNIPENLQGREKYSEVDECCNNLEDVLSSLNDIDRNIEFPRMRR